MSRPARATSATNPRSSEWRGAADRVARELAALQAGQATFIAAARQLLTALTGDPPAPNGPIGEVDLPALLAAYERSLVLWALAKAGGRQLDAAALLGVGPTTLNEKMKRLGVARVCDAAGKQAANAEQHRVALRRQRTPRPGRDEPLRRSLA